MSRLARDALADRRWLMWPLRCMTLPVPVMWNRRAAPLCVLSFGIYLLSAVGYGRLLHLHLLDVARSQDGRKEAPFHVWRLLDHRDFFELLGNLLQEPAAD